MKNYKLTLKQLIQHLSTSDNENVMTRASVRVSEITGHQLADAPAI